MPKLVTPNPIKSSLNRGLVIGLASGLILATVAFFYIVNAYSSYLAAMAYKSTYESARQVCFEYKTGLHMSGSPLPEPIRSLRLKAWPEMVKSWGFKLEEINGRAKKLVLDPLTLMARWE